jgi:hypothetical protein
MNVQPSHLTSGWESDPAGRIRNLSLAANAKNSLFPLFEALMNSIQAIEERFGKDRLSEGAIYIDVHRDQDNEPIGFTITDNGIGFNHDNLSSFKRMDSRAKESIGGKGVGRLVWLKVLNAVKISSTFQSSAGQQRVQFEFTVDEPLKGIMMQPTSEGDAGTTIILSPYRSEYSQYIPKKLSTIANRILAHFISYFINISHPTVIIADEEERIDLFDTFTGSIDRDKDFPFQVKISESIRDFVLHCFLLPKAISDDERSTNALYLGANGRAVKRYDMDAVIGLKAIDSKFAFLGYVEGNPLDASVNDTRTDFSLSDDEIEAIVDSAKARMKEFLGPELQQIRDKQADVVQALRQEHPRFLSIAGTPQDIADTLHYGTSSKEDIFVEMSRKSLRQYEKRKNAFRRSMEKKLPDIQDKAKEYVAGLKQESVSSLAEYVAKRKMILEVFEESLKYREIDEETSEYEDVLHDIICPLRSTTDDLDYEDHNLWIVDDRLAFYSYFDSDTSMKRQIASPEHPRERPDVSIYDIGLGFQNDDKSEPITILEFKRPKFDNYTLDKNPITQVRRYVEDMRKSGQATRYDGTPLRSIDQNTPFMCHIIADITPSLKTVMKSLGQFHQKAGSNDYYCWDPQFSIFIEVSSFKDVLESAKARNRAFFQRIGLVP